MEVDEECRQSGNEKEETKGRKTAKMSAMVLVSSALEPAKEWDNGRFFSPHSSLVLLDSNIFFWLELKPESRKN